MSAAARWAWMPLLLSAAGPSVAQHYGTGHHQGHHGGGLAAPPLLLAPGFGLGALSGGYGYTGFGAGVFAPDYLGTSPTTTYAPPWMASYGPAGFVDPGFAGFPIGGGGLRLPPPPAGAVAQPAPAQPRRTNPAKARELMVIGDRSFRGGNIHRAEGRYLLAEKADPTSPAPGIHLAQVALARKDYRAAADFIRDAVAATPDRDWLAAAPDIQSIYSEPADFARVVARLESHLQVEPGDRDARFVLGVELFLSGRTRPAEDAFRRLTDRRPDEALAAFLDATRPRERPANP